MRSILHFAGELAAGGSDVVAAGSPHRRDDSAMPQHLREGGDAPAR